MEPVWLLSSGDENLCPNPESKIEEIVLRRREGSCVKVISAIALVAVFGMLAAAEAADSSRHIAVRNHYRSTGLAFPLQTDPVFMRESHPGEARKGFFEDEANAARDRSDY
jgi:hypothetical protein